MERENRENSNKVLLIVIGVATLLTAMIGATFAYFSARDTSNVLDVTTATSNLTVTAENNSVTNIRPTTWNATNRDTDTEIVKMTVSVDGTTTASGKYSLFLNEPTIVLGEGLTHDNDATDTMVEGDNEQGEIADFKWAAYDSEGNQIVAPTSFTSYNEADGDEPVNALIPGNGLTGYTKAYTATNGATTTIDDEYYVYVWIENKDADQNKLQEVSFDVYFSVSGTTANN